MTGPELRERKVKPATREQLLKAVRIASGHILWMSDPSCEYETRGNSQRNAYQHGKEESFRAGIAGDWNPQPTIYDRRADYLAERAGQAAGRNIAKSWLREEMSK